MKRASIPGMPIPTTIIGPDADRMAHILTCDGCAICEQDSYYDFMPEGLRPGSVVGEKGDPKDSILARDWEHIR